MPTDLSVASHIRERVERLGISIAPTPIDAIAGAMIAHAGEAPELDETVLGILALERTGHLHPREATHLHMAHIRERGRT